MHSGENRIVVDLDDTLIDLEWPNIGGWKPGAIRGLKKLLEAGYEVMILSTRFAECEIDEVTFRDVLELESEKQEIREMLDDAGLQEVKIWDKTWKPGAVAYIDDKAIRYRGRPADWDIISDTLVRMKNVKEPAEL